MHISVSEKVKRWSMAQAQNASVNDKYWHKCHEARARPTNRAEQARSILCHPLHSPSSGPFERRDKTSVVRKFAHPPRLRLVHWDLVVRIVPIARG